MGELNLFGVCVGVRKHFRGAKSDNGGVGERGDFAEGMARMTAAFGYCAAWGGSWTKRVSALPVRIFTNSTLV